jgi:hypothetical protein
MVGPRQMAPVYNSKGEQVSGWIRPALKVRKPPPLKFQTEIRPDGTRVSSWVEGYAIPLVASGTYGRVGEIMDKINLGSDATRRPPANWKATVDYELVARNLPAEWRAAYIAKSRAWFDAHPLKEVTGSKEVLNYDFELVASMYRKGSRPPIGKRVKVYKAAGVPDALIEKAIAHDAKMEETAEKRQEDLDLFFGKWPSASKPMPKVKKVIKAVKKRIA